MIVCLGLHNGDKAQALSLLSWMAQLGGLEKYRLLLVADMAINWVTGNQLIDAATGWRSVDLITTDAPVSGWPHGCNALWRRAAKWAKDNHTSFLWLEPDAIPTKPGWLDALAKEYQKGGKPFMGRFYSSNNPDLPERLMSGIGVYPENALDLIGDKASGDTAWDMAAASIILPQAHNTRLIVHFWGMKDLAPTFRQLQTPQTPPNTFGMDKLGDDTVLWHRNKDHTLIRLLRMKYFPQTVTAVSGQITVVLPFCHADAHLALAHMAWIAELGPVNHPLLMAIDSTSLYVGEIKAIAEQVFTSVDVFRYPDPPIAAHPYAANWSFVHVARHMEQVLHTPWFWMEPDLVVLKTGWMDVLQANYEAAGMPCMGPVVQGMGHLNGTAIYPANLPSLCPAYFERENGTQHWAFDMIMAPELAGKVADAGYLMQHAWAEVDGRLAPHGGGIVPCFAGGRMLDQLLPTAQTYHRTKDVSLIEALRARRK